MYLVMAGMLDSLTLNTPYPACQTNSLWPRACIHPDEFVLMTRAISAMECAGRMRRSRWTWSSVPLMMRAVLRSCRIMPPRYAKRSERISGLIRGLHCLVLKIKCTTTLPQVCATSFALSGLVCRDHAAQGWRPGLYSCAASRLSNCAASNARKM
jgi:hypothetical protein